MVIEKKIDEKISTKIKVKDALQEVLWGESKFYFTFPTVWNKNHYCGSFNLCPFTLFPPFTFFSLPRLIEEYKQCKKKTQEKLKQRMKDENELAMKYQQIWKPERKKTDSSEITNVQCCPVFSSLFILQFIHFTSCISLSLFAPSLSVPHFIIAFTVSCFVLFQKTASVLSDRKKNTLRNRIKSKKEREHMRKRKKKRERKIKEKKKKRGEIQKRSSKTLKNKRNKKTKFGHWKKQRNLFSWKHFKQNKIETFTQKYEHVWF